VVVLTTFGLDEYVFGALRAGATGFLLKDTPPEQLLQAIRVAAEGDALLSPSITRRLIEAFAQAPAPVRRTGLDLTDREADVLALVARGLSNAQIAGALQIGPATVKTYVSRLLTKLDVSTRVHLVIQAYESGLAG
jgi:DNA-binding NarL/FixJ family response regulator